MACLKEGNFRCGGKYNGFQSADIAQVDLGQRRMGHYRLTRPQST